MNSRQVLEMVVKAADSRRANNIVALNMSKVSLMADYFAIMDASSPRQVQAIANAIIDEAKKHNVDINDLEGMNEAKWILIDLDGVIVHVFQSETRSFYNLEKLWSDAKRVDVNKWLTAD